MFVRVIKAILVGTVAFLIGGCYEADFLIRVQPDGSGTIEKRFVMSGKVIKDIGRTAKPFMSSENEQAQTHDNSYLPNLFHEQKLKNRASLFGEGVAYVSGERISDGTVEGYRAVYRFSDINQVKISMNPSGYVPSHMLAAVNRREKREGEFRFRIEQGSVSKLSVQKRIVMFDRDEAAADTGGRKPPDEEEVEKAAGFLKMIFEPMRVTIQIETDGEIIRTNAAHSENKRITLMDVRFRELNRYPELLKGLINSPDQDYMDALEMVQELPGVLIDPKDEIVVEFK